jgi:DNA-binding HxlR family transcriptional regulator
MDLIGKKFTVLVPLNMIVYKQTQFNQFMDITDGINPKTSTARLGELKRNDLIEGKLYPEVPAGIYCSL